MDERELLYNRFEVVHQYGPALYSWLSHRMGQTSVIEDLMQETFLSAYRGREEFQGKSSLKTWIFAIAQNKFLEYNRNIMRHPLISNDRSFFEEGGKNTSVHSVEDIVIERERSQTAANCYSQLPYHHKVMILLRYEGLSYAEMATALGISLNGVKFRLYRARQAFLRLLHPSSSPQHEEDQ